MLLDGPNIHDLCLGIKLTSLSHQVFDERADNSYIYIHNL